MSKQPPKRKPHAESDELDLALEEAIDEVLDKTRETDQATDEVGQAKRAVSDAEQRALRAQAELENVRKRMRREQQEERKYATMPMLRDLLPTIDNLERALSAINTDECPPGLLQGVQMVASQIIDVLAQHHCQRIDPVGQPFDPMQHEAVGQQPSDEYPAGTVTEVMQTGYILHDRVIRPAQVFVSTGPGSAVVGSTPQDSE